MNEHDPFIDDDDDDAADDADDDDDDGVPSCKGDFHTFHSNVFPFL